MTTKLCGKYKIIISHLSSPPWDESREVQECTECNCIQPLEGSVADVSLDFICSVYNRGYQCLHQYGEGMKVISREKPNQKVQP